MYLLFLNYPYIKKEKKQKKKITEFKNSSKNSQRNYLVTDYAC